MVNFTVGGRLVYPECKNFACKTVMRDGLRVFCNDCSLRLSDPSMPHLLIYLPQMDSKGFSDHMRRWAECYAKFCEDEDLLFAVFKAISGLVCLGLYFYHQAKASKSGRTVLIRDPGSRQSTYAISYCVDKAIERQPF